MHMAEVEGLTELDVRGLLCPLPVLKARKLLKSVPPGGVLRVLATDPGAPKDFEHFATTTGTLLISIETLPDYWSITLRRPPEQPV